MCSFIVSNCVINFKNLDEVNRFSLNRGPDHTNVFKDEESKITWVHNLLHITGEKTIQPFVEKDVISVFNGQIYNFKNFLPEAKSDGYIINEVYKNGSICELDGEYAIVIHDKQKDCITIVSDTFATKPCWISINSEKFAISSDKSSNLSLGFSEQETFKTSPNTVYKLNLKNLKIQKEEIYKFNLKQNVNSFDNWCVLFDLSIKKRTENTSEMFFVGLSSGYDSGCIVSALTKHNSKFTTYSVRAAESLKLLEERHKLLEKNKKHLFHMTKKEYDLHKKYIEEYSEFYESEYVMNNKKYIVQNDKGSVGTSFICNHAKKDGYKIYMSGHGSDEVYSDYGFLGYPIPGFEHCDIAGYYPDNLKDCFPWKNFNGYRMIDFAYKDESVGGSYGIEVRYPFLDRALVQEFLNIDNKLKNKNYKSPLHHYLEKNHYPYLEGPAYKVGFRATSNLI